MIVLQLVEIGGFERAGVSELEDGADPLESEEAQPVGANLGDYFRLI